jgi:hypothetical protein
MPAMLCCLVENPSFLKWWLSVAEKPVDPQLFPADRLVLPLVVPLIHQRRQQLVALFLQALHLARVKACTFGFLDVLLQFALPLAVVLHE